VEVSDKGYNMSSEKKEKKIKINDPEGGMTRREFLALAGGVVVGLAIGLAGGSTLAPKVTETVTKTVTQTVTGTPSPSPTVTRIPPELVGFPLEKYPNWEYYYEPEPVPQPLRYMGGAWMMYPEVEEFWEKVHKQEVECTYVDLFIMAQRFVATGGYGWDVGGTARFRPIKQAGILQPIPVAELPRWDNNRITRILWEPEKVTKFRPAQIPRFKYLLWWGDTDKEVEENIGKNLALVPNNWNFDSVTYLPEFLPYEEQGGKAFSISYSELWNEEWKGRTMMQDEALTVFAETANELDATGQIKIESPFTSLSREEVDKVYNFLLPIVKAGQIKTFWFKYGDAVNLLVSKEIWIGSTWQPICYDTRRAGVPAYYARLVNGPFYWFNGDILSKYTPIREHALKFINFRIDVWWDAFITRNGYGTATNEYEDVKEYMGEEAFGWFNEGKATYLPIDQIIKEICFPDRPELWDLPDRLLQALFIPDKYFPPGQPPREGKPHPRGNLRDLGSIPDKIAITRYFLSPDYPDDPDYYIEKYEELKASMPV